MNAAAECRGGRAAAGLPARWLAVGVLAWAAAAQARAPATASEGPAAAPAAGRYAGELCVRTGDGAAQCGPAEVELRGNRLRVQVSDIAYRLRLRSSQADVVLMHGPMQIDEFVADYRWASEGLQFVDDEKSVRYEVRWTGPKRR